MADLFQPDVGSTVTLAVTTASASASMPLQSESFYLYNAGSGLAFVRWGKGAQTATVNDLPIPSGSIQTFGKEGCDTFAAICATGGTATLYIAPGEGG